MSLRLSPRPGLNGVSRAVALGVLMLAIACSWPTAAGANSTVAEWSLTDDCVDVLVVGSRGSGQSASDASTLGMGPEVYGVADRMAAELATNGLSVGALNNAYPAVGLADYISGDPDLFDSVEAGRLAEKILIHAVVGKCGAATRIVPIGFSQGSMVTRSGVGSLSTVAEDAIAAVVLIADPGYDPEAPGSHLGGADPEKYGLAYWESPEHPLSSAVAERAVHICLAFDSVCQGGDLGDFLENYILGSGLSVHTSGYQWAPLQTLAGMTTAAMVWSSYRCAGLAPTIVGTTGDDQIVGTSGDDVIVGLGGNDTIDGGSGNDAICTAGPAGDSGSGDDDIDAGPGDDYVSTGAGADVVAGGAGVDFISTGDGDDVAGGGTGDDYIDTGNGADDANGGDGNDYLSSGTGDDEVRGGDGDDYITAGDGSDELDGDQGRDFLDGGSGNDHLIGSDDDYLEGGDGNDTLDGSAGSRYLSGGPGADALTGGSNDDYLDGGDGDDTLVGADGDDYLDGGDGDDVMVAGDGNDVLSGGEGTNTFDGEAGNDQLLGGGDADQMDAGSGHDHLFGSGGDDHLEGGHGDDVLVGDGGSDLLDGGAGADLFLGGDGDDRLEGADGEADQRFECGDGVDELVADVVADIAVVRADCEVELEPGP